MKEIIEFIIFGFLILLAFSAGGWIDDLSMKMDRMKEEDDEYERSKYPEGDDAC